jgi:hypothetical protein
MTYETLQQQADQRLLELMTEAREARLARQLRTPAHRRPRRRLHTGTLGHLLALRRHAMQ